MIRSNLSLTLATGGCFVTTHCKEHLIVGADEEIIVLRWLAPGERRPKAGAGGLCVVSRAPTPSHNVVTSLSAIPCQDKDEEGNMLIAVAELLHAVVVYKFFAQGEVTRLVCVKEDERAFLTTSVVFSTSWGLTTLFCSDQSNDRIVVWGLERIKREESKAEEEKGEAKEEKEKEDEVEEEKEGRNNRLPKEFRKNRSEKMDLKMMELFKWEQPFKASSDANGSSDKVSILISAGTELPGVLAISPAGKIAVLKLWSKKSLGGVGNESTIDLTNYEASAGISRDTAGKALLSRKGN